MKADARTYHLNHIDETACSCIRRKSSFYPQLMPSLSAATSVERWLAENKWQRDWRYNPNFGGHALVEQYESIERQENPLFWKDAYATLGGWHMGWPDDDWQDLLDAKLLVHTYMDSEPWVEAWQLASGEFRVIQRIT